MPQLLASPIWRPDFKCARCGGGDLFPCMCHLRKTMLASVTR